MNSITERKNIMTQTNTVINHLNNNRKLTSIEAIGLYGITRLAAVVYTLRKSGLDVTTTMKDGVNKTQYAEYSLVH
jgi:hypothetical protein|tara:strand:- start:373 stop:600 length:228 start_codon:yes stop_codon:yes gene_type:complete